MDQPEPMLIEGRNRRAACRIADITPTFAVYFLRAPSTLEPVRQIATKVATEGYR